MRLPAATLIIIAFCLGKCHSLSVSLSLCVVLERTSVCVFVYGIINVVIIISVQCVCAPECNKLIRVRVTANASAFQSQINQDIEMREERKKSGKGDGGRERQRR